MSTINFSIHGSNKRLFNKFYEGLGLNQAYLLLKLQVLYSVNMLILNTNGKFITAINKNDIQKKKKTKTTFT